MVDDLLLFDVEVPPGPVQIHDETKKHATVKYVPPEQVQRFRELQEIPYRLKIQYAIGKAQEFFEELDGKVFCSVGGLDSITLLLFLRKHVDPNIPGVTISVLEDKTVRAVHKQLDNMIYLKPYKSKVQVIREHGYPVISKEKAGKIQLLQNPTEKNATVRHAIMTGETGAYGGWRTGTKMRLPQKWLDLFAGPENAKYGTNYQTAPFRVSPDCCYYMKEKPADDYAKKTGLKPYMGLMASEGGQREKALIKNGCNYYGKTVIRSCPFAIFQRQDILQLALDLKVPVPEIYGDIVRDPDGTLRPPKLKEQAVPCAALESISKSGPTGLTDSGKPITKSGGFGCTIKAGARYWITSELSGRTSIQNHRSSCN